MQKQLKSAKDGCTTGCQMVLVHSYEDLLSGLVSRRTRQGFHHGNAWSCNPVSQVSKLGKRPLSSIFDRFLTVAHAT